MAKFKMDPDVFAHLLDLPEGTELGEITRAPVGNGRHVYVVSVTGPDWPDGMVELHYSQDQHGTVSLKGFTPVE
jgi:hypothetical protein